MEALDVQDLLEYARAAVAVIRGLKITGSRMRYGQLPEQSASYLMMLGGSRGTANRSPLSFASLPQPRGKPTKMRPPNRLNLRGS